jgi:hypothetical protein
MHHLTGKNSGRASPASRGSEAQTPPRRKPVGILSKPPKVPRVAFSAPTSPFLAPQTGTSTNFPMHSLHPLDDALHLQIEQETPLQTDDELLVITVDSPRRASSASPHSPRSPQGSPLARPSPRRPQSSSKRTPSPSSKLGIFGPSHRCVFFIASVVVNSSVCLLLGKPSLFTVFVFIHNRRVCLFVYLRTILLQACESLSPAQIYAATHRLRGAKPGAIPGAWGQCYTV